MKKIVKFGLLTLSIAAVFSLASCKKEDNGLDKVIDYSDNLDIDMTVDPEIDEKLSSISFDTTNAKTHYYVGEAFTTEGLVVNANYIISSNGTTSSSTKAVTSYFYDASELDMSKVGIYSIKFTYREANIIKTNNLQITVTESLLADSGVKYLAGLEPTQTVFEVSKNATIDYKSIVTFQKKYMQGKENTVIEAGVEEMSAADLEALTVDSSAVKIGTAGKYIVKYSYKASVALPDTPNYEYTLSSFIVLIVR